MIVRNEPLSFYIDKLKNGEYFSQGMYGDGEWIAIFKSRVGGENAEHTKYTPELCNALRTSLTFKEQNFLFSTPAGLKDRRASGIGEQVIDACLKEVGVEIEFYEKDMWDKEMKSGGLVDFINQLRKMNVVVIGNQALSKLDFLRYDKFIEISYPNCYLDGSLTKAVEECLAYGKPGVYLFSAGLPAVLAVQQLHGKIPNSFFIDCGSIWDTFVGIGAQRGFRSELYADEEKYNAWKKLYTDAIK